MTAPNEPRAAQPQQQLSADPQVASPPGPARVLSPAAQRALAEAAARRAEIDRRAAALSGEQNGRRGPEPVRYGDWEIKGLASDF